MPDKQPLTTVDTTGPNGETWITEPAPAAPAPVYNPSWEQVGLPLDHTDRLAVPGGWLYRTQSYGLTDRHVQVTFVPTPHPSLW